MPKDERDRIPLDVREGLRERITKAYENDPAWRHIAITRQARILIEERLDQIEAEKRRNENKPGEPTE